MGKTSSNILPLISKLSIDYEEDGNYINSNDFTNKNIYTTNVVLSEKSRFLRFGACAAIPCKI